MRPAHSTADGKHEATVAEFASIASSAKIALAGTYTLVDGVSAVMSYTSAATTLSTMGMRLHHVWRTSFLLFCSTSPT